MNEIKPIDIYSHSVTLYGGKDGFHGGVRSIIALYDIELKIIAWIKFFDNLDTLEKDFIKDGQIFVNMPMSSYQAVLAILRSPLRIQLIYHHETQTAMLCELNEPRIIPADKVDRNKVN